MTNCEVCGKKTYNLRYCSNACRKADKRPKEAVNLDRDVPKKITIEQKIKAYGGTPSSYAAAQKAESIELFARVNLDDFFAQQKHVF